jgi:probable rRNA maturation factor
MTPVTLTISNPHDYPVDEDHLHSTATDELAAFDLPPVSIDISFVDTDRITELNESQLQHHGETDVLSFPPHEDIAAIQDYAQQIPADEPVPLGDIVICFPRAERDAQQQSTTTPQVIEFYLRHSILHLLGFHHA